jgi:hypothetical protein
LTTNSTACSHSDDLIKVQMLQEAQVLPPGKSTVNDWHKPAKAQQIRQQLQQAVTGNEQAKRQRKAKFPELEQALALWFRQQELRDLPITDELLREQAKTFGPHFDVPDSFSFSDCWLGKFKKRQGIKQSVKHGEANNAGVQLCREAVPLIAEDGGYVAEDIYNQDETEQFWRQVPQHSLATGKRAGRKKDKQRITASV